MVSPEKIDVTGILADQLVLVWRDASALIEPALIDGITISDVLTAIYNNKAQLWIAATPSELVAAIVTEVIIRDDEKLCRIWAAGGKGLNNWLHYIADLEEWAAQEGCKAIVIEKTRHGWKRLLDGYRVASVNLRKELK